MVDFCDELHFDGLEGIRFGDHDVLGECKRKSGSVSYLTYYIKVAAFVWGSLGAVEGADEVVWRAVYEIELDMRRLVVLAIC